ncbi:LysR substrate-binding domain-containing protein [Paracoccus jiaweipingae]|uniref:LysR substrate-binding domain-containing protein n=1 Tax=unclassified Paracoccus (in: a-proteobacteria) TaxID=2688777 RepID=UPI0037A261BA
MGISLRQLRYFLALVETGHFGHAADRVHVTQPALSMQIRELEAALGAVLVERMPRGIALTPAGREAEQRARRIIAEITELSATARRGGLAGRLNLGIIPTVAPYLLPAALPDLRAADITRDLRLHEAPTDRLLGELAGGRLDAVVIATPAPDDAVEAPLLCDRFLLAGSPARLAGLADPLPRPDGLDPDQLLLLDEGHCLGDQALAVCGLSRGVSRLDLGAASLSTLCRLAGQGMGLTFLPELAAAQELAAAPGLAARRFATPQPARELRLVRRASTDPAGWFDDLAARLASAGQRLCDGADAAIGG